MTEPLQVGQFAIVDHEPVDRGPNAGVFFGKGPTDDRAELYIVAEGTTPAGESFAGHVVSAIGQAWTTYDMSLTGALQRLFAEAARNLDDWNRKSIAQHRVSLGISCVARRGGQTVIAQAGPTAAFHLSRGRVTPCFPGPGHETPVGVPPLSQPQLTPLTLDPGDRVLLVSTPVLAEIDEEILRGIVALPAGQVLPDIYHRLARRVRFVTAVMLVAPETPARVPVPAPPPPGEFVIDATVVPGALPPAAKGEPAAGAYQPSLFLADAPPGLAAQARQQLLSIAPRRSPAIAEMPAAVTEVPAPLRRVAGESLRAALASTQGVAAAARPQWHNSAGGEGGVRRHDPRRTSFSRGLVRGEPPPRPAPYRASAPLAGELAAGRRAEGPRGPIDETIAAERAGPVPTNSLVRVRGNMGGRWKAQSLSSRGTVGSVVPPTWLVIIIGLGILLALVSIVVLPGAIQEGDSRRYARLVDGAQQQLATARAQEDPAERRRALNEAHALLLEAREADPSRPGADALIDQVAGAIATMDAVRTPAAVDTIADLSQFGERPVAASWLAIGRDSAYLLDSSSHQVIAITLATGEKKVIFAEDAPQQRGRPAAIAYLESAGALLVLDSGRLLWSFNAAQGLQPVRFAAPPGMTVTDIAAHDGNLYVLDAAAAAVYRFAPADGGFGAPPAKLLSSPDLSAARRLMADGEIVTADANGTLHRFSGQLSLVLSQAGIDRRLAAAEPPQPFSPLGEIAVLDAQADRILVFKRDGTFDHQYRHRDFQGITAVALRDGVAYVFAGGQLRRVTW